jgi:hypothetical protein
VFVTAPLIRDGGKPKLADEGVPRTPGGTVTHADPDAAAAGIEAAEGG